MKPLAKARGSSQGAKESRKRWAKKNPDKVKKIRERNIENKRARDKEYFNRNRKRLNEKRAEYRKNHLEQENKRAKLWRKNNPDRVRELTKKWKKANPQKYKLLTRKIQSKRRMKLKGSVYPIGISVELQKKILARDVFCVYNGCDKNLEIDHIIPIGKFGTNNHNNLVLCCRSCNAKKNDKDVFEWCKEQGIEVPEIVKELLNKQKEQTELLRSNQ